MRVCFDLRTAQKNSRYTGIGIYTYEVGRRLVQEDPDIFFLVRENCQLPFTIPGRRLIKVRSFNKPESLQEIIDPIITFRKLLNNKIDVFHSPVPGYIRSNSSFKLITTVHDVIPDIYPEEKHKPFFNALLYKKKNKYASTSNFIIFDSYCTQNDFIKFYGEPKKYSVVYLGAEQSNEFKREVNFDFNFYGKYIFYIGGFNKRKNFDYLFRILPEILAEHDLNFVIGGNISNQDKNRIRDLCKSNDVDFRKVLYTGRLSPSELSRFYKFSYFFIYPSMYEGFGLPIAEALNSECLVFSTNNSSIPEVGGESIIYITGSNPETDTELIKNTLQNENLIKHLKNKAKSQRDLFSWDKTTKTTLEIYKKVYENTY